MAVTLSEIFNKDAIEARARNFWDDKSSNARNKIGRKYNHLFIGAEDTLIPWDNNFNELLKVQKNLIVKGELIRTYDNLPNKDKTKLKNMFGLSVFSSKWFKLPSKDKELLLKFVI